jgi:membrane protease YdiL (CAAX protease family)
MIKWRVGWHWYALALGIPLTVGLGATALNGVFGAPSVSLPQIIGANGDARELNGMLGIGSVLSLILAYLLRLISPTDGPLGEEPGWRGYALPSLQATRSPLTAALIVGVLAAGWRLPLIFVGANSPFELLAPFCLGIVASWMFYRTGGSVLLTLMLHTTDGLIQIERLGFVGADAERIVWLYSGLWCAMAIGVVIFDWKTWQARRPMAPQEVLPAEALLKP